METKKIKTYYGPEDIVTDPFRANRLIISCCRRKGLKVFDGCIQYYDVDTSEGNGEAENYDLSGYSHDDLRPHGIFAKKVGEKCYLYVISHEAEDKVIQFLINNNTLIHVKTFSSDDVPMLKGANDLFVADDGAIYFTATRSSILAGLRFRNSIVGSISADGIYKVVVDKLRFANGIYILHDTMYITDTMKNQLLSFDLSASDIQRSEEILADLKGGDNISFMDNKLIIARHPKMWKFYIHSMKQKVKSPTAVTEYDISTGFGKEIYQSDGEDISAGSIALRIGHYLYIGQAFNSYILRVERSGSS